MTSPMSADRLKAIEEELVKASKTNYVVANEALVTGLEALADELLTEVIRLREERDFEKVLRREALECMRTSAAYLVCKSGNAKAAASAILKLSIDGEVSE